MLKNQKEVDKVEAGAREPTGAGGGWNRMRNGTALGGTRKKIQLENKDFLGLNNIAFFLVETFNTQMERERNCF